VIGAKWCRCFASQPKFRVRQVKGSSVTLLAGGGGGFTDGPVQGLLGFFRRRHDSTVAIDTATSIISVADLIES